MHVSDPAATTAEAKRLVAAQVPALAVVDVNLKREMASDLDDLHEQGVRVVVVSGYAVPPVSAQKVRRHLQKPFSAAELLTALCIPSLVKTGCIETGFAEPRHSRRQFGRPAVRSDILTDHAGDGGPGVISKQAD